MQQQTVHSLNIQIAAKSKEISELSHASGYLEILHAERGQLIEQRNKLLNGKGKSNDKSHVK